MKTHLLPLLLVLFAGLFTLAACDVLSSTDGSNANANPNAVQNPSGSIEGALCDVPTTTDLVRQGSTPDVRGLITVTNDEDNLYVTFDANAGFLFQNIRLWVGTVAPTPLDPGTGPGDIPQIAGPFTPGGDVTTYTETIPLTWAPGTTLYLVANATLHGASGQNWGQGTIYGDHARYFTHVVCGEVLEGCSQGFWRNHTEDWQGYDPDDDFDTVFGVDMFEDDLTLHGALENGGGGYNALGRQAVAALLNAAHGDVNFAYTEAEVIALVQDAVANNDPEPTKDLLEAANTEAEGGCPLGD